MYGLPACNSRGGTACHLCICAKHRFFEEFPASPLEVVAKDAVTAPAAYYMQGTADRARPGRFYVNVSNLVARPK
jgi:uncharacterized protein (DUF885 family)